MTLTYVIALISALLLIILITQCVRILREDERLVVLDMGRVTDVLGPGLVFMLPGAKTYVSVICGDPGEMLGPKMAHLNGYHLPVRVSAEQRPFQLPCLCRVAGFEGQNILVTCLDGPAASEQ